MYKVYRGSGDYVRIAQPWPHIKQQKINFRLEEIQNSEIFGITKKGGIVYIKDAEHLKQFNQSQFA